MTRKQDFINRYAEKLKTIPLAPQWRGNEFALAEKMTEGFITGQSSNKGTAIEALCKELKIKATYKALREYLTTEA